MIQPVGTGPQNLLSSDAPRLSPIMNQWPGGIFTAVGTLHGSLLEPGGFLITCSCSYNVGEAAFVDVVSSAASDAHATVTMVEKRTQGRDHPILINVPETYYLKCLVLRKLD